MTLTPSNPFQTIWDQTIKNRWLFVKVLAITFVLSCIYIFSLPRYYKTEVVLMPEKSTNAGSNSIASLAATFGLSLGDGDGESIQPEIYPDIIATNDFAVRLFPIKIREAEGQEECDYYTYLTEYSPAPWWKTIGKSISAIWTDKAEQSSGEYDVRRLNKHQSEVCEAVLGNIECEVDRRTDMVTITVTDCDPLVCVCLADSLCKALQDYITEHRTYNTRREIAYYEEVSKDAYAEYQVAMANYSRFTDKNLSLSREESRQQLATLRNEMDMALANYTGLVTQLQSTKAKLLEQSSAFYVVKSPSLPYRPAGPHRMFFVAFMLILAFAGTYCWLAFFKDMVTNYSAK